MIQQKFISQLVTQDATCIHNFDSESEQQSMQCNERIGQNCRFITLCNAVFFHVECKQPTTDKMYKIFTAQKSYCACRLLSLATKRRKHYFNFILNRIRSGRELFDRPSYICFSVYLSDHFSMFSGAVIYLIYLRGDLVNKRQRHCASRIARFISNNSASYLLSHGTVDARTENCMLFYVTENVVAEDELIERDT